MTIRKIPRIPDDMPLYDILNEFQKGHSHIAVVYRDLNGKAKSARNGRQIEIKDSCKKKQEDKSKKLGKTGDNEAGQEASVGEPGWEYGVTGNRTSLAKNDESQLQRQSPPPTPAFRKRHRGCSFCILDIENSSIPEFPPNEVVVGVISMEDVIEELLQEEILDETDEYVNIHNRIKVNMHAVPEKASGSNSLPAYSSASSATSTPSPTSRRLGFAGSTMTLSVSTSNSVANSPLHH